MKCMIFALTTLSIGLVEFYSIFGGGEKDITILRSNTFFSGNTVEVTKLTLIAREELGSPPGQRFSPDRNIGFATVFLQANNKSLVEAELTILSVEIQDVDNGSLQMKVDTPEIIRFHALENLVKYFHLTNKSGYSTQNLVKAVVFYQVNGQELVIESEPVEIERLF